MKNKYWFLYPWIVLLVIGGILALAAVIDGNIWLFRDFFKLDSYVAWDIIRAIIVAICDIVIAAFIIKNAAAIAADDDLE